MQSLWASGTRSGVLLPVLPKDQGEESKTTNGFTTWSDQAGPQQEKRCTKGNMIWLYKILGLGKKQLFMTSSNIRIGVAGVGASDEISLWQVQSKRKEIGWVVQTQPGVKLWDCHRMYN